MGEPSRVRVSGPLAPFAPGLIGCLADRGYGSKSVVEHVRRLALLSRWLERDGIDPVVLDEDVLERFLGVHHREGRGRMLSCRSFRVVLGFLRSQGVVPAPARVSTPIESLLDAYCDYLALERGLVPMTITGYLVSARWFLSATCANDVGWVGMLSAGDVARFIVAAARVRSGRSVNEVVVGVRSLLRYFYLHGLIDTPLAQATPWLARGRMSSLPRTLPAGTAKLLLASCDRHRLVGVRDFAVITVLVRLGLRVGEVAAMELGDIDWRRGEVMVRSKGGWRDPLPIPVDVGEALVAYLARRGTSGEDRHVFMQVRPPRGPMTMTDIRAVVRRACRRAGIADTSTHRLRHGVAGDLLRHGAALHEIGQVLRHRDLATTAVYAKVDFAALATVAQPWPRSAS